MRKLLVVFMFCFCFAVSTKAQTDRIGFTGGLSIASQKWKEGNFSFTSDSKAGLTIGIIADVLISDQFSFQPALNFIQKGGKFKSTDLGIGPGEDIFYTLNYLELPLNFVYKIKAGKGKFFIGAGPSFGLAINGQTKRGDFSIDLEFGSDNSNDYKPIDLGGNLVACYELSNGLFISLNYYTTLSNISTEQNDIARNKVFGIRVGYFLNSRTK